MARRRTEHPLDKNLTLRMSRELYDRIDRIAAARELTVGTMVRQVLEQWAQRTEKEPKA